MYPICDVAACTHRGERFIPIGDHEIGPASLCISQCAIETSSSESPVAPACGRKLDIEPQNWKPLCLFHHRINCNGWIRRIPSRDHVVGSERDNDCRRGGCEALSNDLGTFGCKPTNFRVDGDCWPHTQLVYSALQCAEIASAHCEAVAYEQKISLTICCKGNGTSGGGDD